MNTKHTPGPWAVGTTMRIQTSNGLNHESTPIYGEEIAVAECKAWVSDERDMVAANARLIAAAPEMLDLLRKLADEIGRIPAFGDGIGPASKPLLGTYENLARTILAKIEG